MSTMIDCTRDTRGVATLWLARPEKHNALSAGMMTDLQQAAETLAQDTSVRVVVLAARGETPIAGRPGASLKPYDFAKARKELETICELNHWSFEELRGKPWKPQNSLSVLSDSF